MVIRRLEFSDGTSRKFWEIGVAGSAYTVRFGRLGTEGQLKTKTFESPGAARAACAKVVSEELAKGPQSGSPSPRLQRPSRPATSPRQSRSSASSSRAMLNPTSR
jgi:predicted DNA-binding WGR domain protein